MGKLIQEPELCFLDNLGAGTPFVVPNDTVEKVMCKVIGDCGCRGAGNAACVVLATAYEGNDGVRVGSMFSLPRNIMVQPLELVTQPLYKRV